MTVYSFITIDDPFATAGTFAEGINGKGQIVGTYRHASDTHGFVDTGIGGGTCTTLDDPEGTATHAYGINDAGQIVGTYYDASNNPHGFLYSGGGYTTLDDPLGATRGAGAGAGAKSKRVASGSVEPWLIPLR